MSRTVKWWQRSAGSKFRLLPSIEPAQKPRFIVEHVVKLPNGRQTHVPCGLLDGCLLCDTIKQLRETGQDQLAMMFCLHGGYVQNILVLDDVADPSNNHQVFGFFHNYDWSHHWVPASLWDIDCGRDAMLFDLNSYPIFSDPSPLCNSDRARIQAVLDQRYLTTELANSPMPSVDRLNHMVAIATLMHA